MTKKEYENCEKLMEEAIRNMESSNEYWDEYEKAKKENKSANAEVAMRKFDYYRGHADGIYDTLVMIGFRHERMKELCELSK